MIFRAIDANVNPTSTLSGSSVPAGVLACSTCNLDLRVKQLASNKTDYGMQEKL